MEGGQGHDSSTEKMVGPEEQGHPEDRLWVPLDIRESRAGRKVLCAEEDTKSLGIDLVTPWFALSCGLWPGPGL